VCPFFQAPPGWVVCVRPQGVTAACISKHDRMRREIGKPFGRGVDVRRLGECRWRSGSDHTRCVNRHSGAISFPGGVRFDRRRTGRRTDRREARKSEKASSVHSTHSFALQHTPRRSRILQILHAAYCTNQFRKLFQRPTQLIRLLRETPDARFAVLQFGRKEKLLVRCIRKFAHTGVE
jgi:hypothetical protein